jgi:quercetin dioxygenase-like cupin family protein
MKHVHYTDVPAEDVGGEAKGVKIRWLIAEKDGAPNFHMRHFEIAPGGNTPLHAHAWEHEVFILKGAGVLGGAAEGESFKPGDVVFMPGGVEHNFQNTGAEPVEMLCLIPRQ